MSRKCYEHEVPLSVCPSVTLVDCDHRHRVQQKVESAHDRIGRLGRCLGSSRSRRHQVVDVSRIFSN